MKILFLTQLFPYPPVCGGTIRSYNILRHLAARHDVTLVSFVRKPLSEEQVRAGLELCRDMRTVPIRRSAAANVRFAAASLASRRPFIVARDFVPAMQRTVGELAESGRFDLAYVDHLQMAQYLMSWRACPKVLDEHNVEWKVIQRIAARERTPIKRLFAEIEWRKLRRWEARACRSFDLVFTVTENDLRTLAADCPDLSSFVCIPIGVDFERFPSVKLDPDSKDIVSIATMSWPPNIDSILYFASRVYPKIKERVDGVRLVIVGSSPPEAIRRLGKADESIEVAGFVPDLRVVASRTAAFIVPLRSGSGLRVKILNAMAMGLPIVSTSVGCEGIGAEPGRHLLVADGAAEFAEAVVRLLADYDLRRRLARGGSSFVRANYGWNTICSRLDAALDRLLQSARSGI